MDYRILSIGLLLGILVYVLYRIFRKVFGHPDGIPFSTLNDMFEAILISNNGSQVLFHISKEHRLYSNMAEAQTMQIMPELYGFVPGDKMVFVPDYIVVSKSGLVPFGRDVFDFNLTKTCELVVHTSPGFTVYHQATIIQLGDCHVHDYGVSFDAPLILVHPEPTTLRTTGEIHRHMAGYAIPEFITGFIRFEDMPSLSELPEWILEDLDLEEEDEEEDEFGIDDDDTDDDNDG